MIPSYTGASLDIASSSALSVNQLIDQSSIDGYLTYIIIVVNNYGQEDVTFDVFNHPYEHVAAKSLSKESSII